MDVIEMNCLETICDKVRGQVTSEDVVKVLIKLSKDVEAARGAPIRRKELQTWMLLTEGIAALRREIKQRDAVIASFEADVVPLELSQAKKKQK